MKNMKRSTKVMALIVCLVMTFMLSVTAFAEGTTDAKNAAVEALTEGITLENGVYTNSEKIVLDFASASEINSGFGSSLWRVIFRLKVAETVTDGEIAQAKYYRELDGEWAEIGLISESDFYNAEEKYIDIAVVLNADDLSKETVEASYAFDWDCNGTEETVQIVNISLDMSKVELVHSAGCTEYTDVAQIDPTCTQVGYTKVSHCSVCGLDMQTGEEIDSLGHDFAEKIITDKHFKVKNGDGTSSYFYNCSREGCDEVSTIDTYLVYESDYNLPLAEISAFTSGLSIEGDASVAVTNKEVITLDFAAADSNIGRPVDGWWAGIKITPAESLTDEELMNVKYRIRSKNVWSEDYFFWDSKESDNEHYMTVWVLVTPERIENDDDGILSYAFDFDWDNNGFGISTQLVTFEIDTTKVELIHSAGHDEVIDIEQVKPDCYNGGYTKQSHCAVCGLVLSERKAVAALGHGFTKKIISDEYLCDRATCTHFDRYYYSCVRCEMIGTETFEDTFGSSLLPHEEIRKPDKLHIATPADCYNPAVYYMGCKNCDTLLDEKYTDGTPLYHSWKNEQVTKKAGINTAGTINFFCVDCGEKDKTPIAIAAITSIKLSETKYNYTGKKITPAVTVKDSAGNTLLKGRDYNVTYVGADLPGTATAVITFMGNYEGTYNAKYTIQIPATSKITYTSTTNTIKLSWEKVSVASGYTVYYKVATGWKKLGNTTATSATFKNLPSGTQYTFAVKSIITKNSTLYPSTIFSTVDTTTTSAATSKITATQSTSAIKLTWSAVKGAEGYAVYYKVATGWKLLKITSATTVTFSNLKAGVSYTFAVRSIDLTASKVRVAGSYSQILTGTKPAKPTVSVTTEDGDATIRWTGVKGATGYEIYYKSDRTDGYVLLGTAGAGSTSFTDTGYTTGSKYTFAVRAMMSVQNGYIYSATGAATVTMN